MVREKLLSYAVKQLTRMDLVVLIGNVDYRGSKPDLVVIYPEKGKYYLTEIIADDCFQPGSQRFKSAGYDALSREYCRKLYQDLRLSVWAAGLYCDLGQGIELFGYSELNGIRFDKMQKYASMIYPVSLNAEAEEVFNKFEILYRSIDVSGIFTLTLFSHHDSLRLAETRRFMHFLAVNRKNQHEQAE